MLTARAITSTRRKARSRRQPTPTRVCSRHRRTQHARRLGHAVALRVVHAQAGQLLDDLSVLGKLRDGLLLGVMRDLVDGLHHLAVHRVVQNLTHEAAVDLEEINREMLQVAES